MTDYPSLNAKVIRLDGGYRRGKTGTVVQRNEESNPERKRIRVLWDDTRIRTWVKIRSIALA